MARFSGDPPLCHYASKWSTSLESLACVAHDPQPVNSRIQNASHLSPVAAMASAWKFVDVMRWPGWDQHWDGMKNQHNIIRFIVDLPIENGDFPISFLYVYQKSIKSPTSVVTVVKPKDSEDFLWLPGRTHLADLTMTRWRSLLDGSKLNLKVIRMGPYGFKFEFTPLAAKLLVAPYL